MDGNMICYNAVIYNDFKIVARATLTDPRSVPWWWEIRSACGNEVVAVKDVECDPQHPMRIIKRSPFLFTSGRRGPVGEQEFEVMFPVDERMLRLKVKESNVLEDLLWMATREAGTEDAYNLGKLVHVNGKKELWKKLHWTLEKLGVNAKNNRFRLLSSEELPDFYITVNNTTGREFKLRVHAHISVEQLKTMIEEEIGVPLDQQSLIYDRYLEDSRILGDYNIKSQCKLWLVVKLSRRMISFWRMRMRGYGNSKGKRVTEVGTPAKPKDPWRGYGKGLNLKGNCSNPACKSQKFKTKDLVIFNVGFGDAMLECPTLHCPACRSKTFKPNSFLVSGARCSFQYQWTGCKSRKTITVGSDAPFPKYVEMKIQEGKPLCNYIGIRTVLWDDSPHNCFRCAKEIGSLENEATATLEGCEHHWHKDCHPEVDCAICSAPLISETAIEGFCETLMSSVDEANCRHDSNFILN